MCPVGVGTGRLASALVSGEAKLWVVLVGVNQVQDKSLPTLRYAARDCQGLQEALLEATQAFPQKDISIHSDLAEQPPLLDSVKASVQRMVAAAKPRDTVLFYFSGHGVLDLDSQQTFLCLADTSNDHLLETGLKLQELLALFSNCATHNQLLWLDACHSGNMSLVRAKGKREGTTLLNATPQLLGLLRQRAAKSKGFYALLSCDQDQRSWEFPDLKHGVFSYYLMRGLRGEAANSQGIIDADGLYRYVYHQTVYYIEQANQQLRLVNQQKRSRGESSCYQEYSLQTPKRIVEGVGEILLGLKPSRSKVWQPRQALLVEGGQAGNPISPKLSEVLRQEGNFEITSLPQPELAAGTVQDAIAAFLEQPIFSVQGEQIPLREMATLFFYLRGRLENAGEEEACLALPDGSCLKRSWLRQKLRRARMTQQLVIFDCLGTGGLEDWLEELKCDSEYGQCLILVAVPEANSDRFASLLVDSLKAATAQEGLAVAGWLTALQARVNSTGLEIRTWLSGAQGVIEVFPRKVTTSAQRSQVSESSPAAKVGLSPKQYATLEKILKAIVGPIAPSLLKQVTSQECSTQMVMENLSLHLTPAQRLELEKKTVLLLPDAQAPAQPSPAPLPATQLSEPTPPPAPGPLQPSAAPAENNTEATQTQLSLPPPPIQPERARVDSALSLLRPDQYASLEAILSIAIGPIAPLWLKKAIARASNLNEVIPGKLLDELGGCLTPSQKRELERQIAVWLQDNVIEPAHQSSLQPQTRSELPTLAQEQTAAGSGIQRSLDNAFIGQCERDLASFVGPIAPLLISKTLSTHPQIAASEFVTTLAAQIPDPNQAEQFRQHCLNF
jgi:uncharacterized caspase-like protein